MRKDRVLAGALAAVTALSMTACGGGQAGGTTQAAAAGTQAISCGAVFMGANTYIGNAPNFMVKSIADENGVRMPSFFGYLLWSFGILVPVFALDMLLFFL